jgi:hypothetical protein
VRGRAPRWSAFAPLSGETFEPAPGHLVPTATLVGAGVLVVGLVVLAFALGVRVGAGRRGRGPR